MINISKKFKLILIILVLLGQIFFSDLKKALAYGGISFVPEPLSTARDVMSMIESTYNINRNTLKSASQQFNVSEQKVSAPEVSVSFNPQDPQEGKKITAYAAPIYFQNSKENLYYTWYIMHKECEKKTDPNDEQKRICDADGDDDIDENDWKVEAMRMIATNGYDNEDANYSEEGGGDKDEYEASFGGHDKKSSYKYDTGGPYCYVHDFSNGENCEIVNNIGKHESDCKHLFPKTYGTDNIADGKGFGKDVEKFWRTNPKDPNTAGNGNLDEANVAGLGQDSFSWTFRTGDKVGVAVEGTSMIPTKHAGSSYMVMWALPNNDFTCQDNDYTLKTCDVTCNTSGLVPKCVKKETSGTDYLCQNIGDPVCDESNGVITATCSDSEASVKCVDSVQEDNDYLCYRRIKYNTNVEPETGCPYINSFVFNKDFYTKDNEGNCNLQNSETDPEKLPKIACENLFFSLGACENGDDAEIVLPTTMQEAKIDKATCIVEKKYSETVKGYSVSFPSVETDGNEGFDLNKCLKDNLVDPAEKKYGKFDVELAYNPENPINDPSVDDTSKTEWTGGENGDLLTVNAVVSNETVDPAYIYYDWEISASPTSNGSFNKIDNKTLKNIVFGKMKGANLSKIGIKLRLPDEGKYFKEGVGYLKITATLKGVKGEKIISGKGEVVIKINSSKDMIDVSLAKIGSSQKLSWGNEICKKVTGSEISVDSNKSLSYFICPVMQNQIIGMRVKNSNLNNFSWMVNGQAINCDSEISDECSDEMQGDTIFFPITWSAGKNINVKVTATKYDESLMTSQNIEINRTLAIVEPYVKIVSTDQNSFWPKLMGNYFDSSGSSYPDFSEENYLVYNGAEAKLKAEFHPASLESMVVGTENGDIRWKLDGTENFSSSPVVAGKNTFSFKAEKNIGEFYDIQLETVYQIPLETRAVLEKNWGITEIENGSRILSDSIIAEVMDQEVSGTMATRNARKIMASLVANFPSQLAFLFRTALIIFVIVLSAGVALNFSPSLYKNKK